MHSEVHAVQAFAQILVNDYRYRKEHLQTPPQWRVKVRPSDTPRPLSSIKPNQGNPKSNVQWFDTQDAP